MANMMLMFDPLKQFLTPPEAIIDNLVFQLHYKVTCGIFLLFTILNGASQYFGEPIECHVKSRGNHWAGDFMSLYCWGKGTYTIEHKATGMDYDTDLRQAHPGVGTYSPDEHDKVFHDYYQWVCFWTLYLLLAFCVTREMWKRLEGEKMKFITNGMKYLEENDTKEEERLNKMTKAYKYMCSNPHKNDIYANKYIFCEVINFINVIVQFFTTDLFMGGQFIDYGARFFNPKVAGKLDAFHKVFPKVTKCDFNKFGPGGDITNMDVVCVLPLNIVNEKMFLLMWLWLLVLLLLNALNLMYRAVIVFAPNLRLMLVFRFTTLDGASKNDIQAICRNSGYGDWFILKLLMKNVHSDTFGRFLSNLANEKKESRRLHKETNLEKAASNDLDNTEMLNVNEVMDALEGKITLQTPTEEKGKSVLEKILNWLHNSNSLKPKEYSVVRRITKCLGNCNLHFSNEPRQSSDDKGRRWTVDVDEEIGLKKICGAKTIDVGAKTTDGGTKTTDVGAKATDGGVKTIDGGARTTDGDIRTTDGGARTTDGGTKTTDGGANMTDKGAEMTDEAAKTTDGANAGGTRIMSGYQEDGRKEET